MIGTMTALALMLAAKPGQPSMSPLIKPVQGAIEATPFDAGRNAQADVDAALARAAAGDKRVALVLGANWCHDSRSLAGRLTLPRFALLIAERYEVVYIDVGQRDRNLDIARRFGIDRVTGTPTLLILSPDGRLLNRADAARWRDAASRSDDAVYAYFLRFATALG